ncbi:MAG: glycosyltransferase family 4 protein [Bacteroidia bacterium]
MKIAIITDGIFPYVMGGMQKHSFYLCKFLAQKGVKIDLYHTNQQTKHDITKLEFFTEEEKANITSIVVPFPASDKLPGHYIRASKKYSELLYLEYQKREKTDFIYSKGLAAWKFLKEKENGVALPPISVKVHGYEMFQIAPSFRVKLEHLLLRPVFRFVNEKADYIFSYGGGITDIILQHFQVKKENIFDIPTGIDAAWVYEGNTKVNTPRKFVFLGRYERRKGIEELNVVLEKLKTTQNFEFHFIGPIEEEKQVKSEKITYHGQTSDINKIKNILQNADVLVCPSYSEGMPNVIMEAMASGCAVLATNVGAVNVMTNDENGWLIPPADINALEYAMIAALNLEENALLAKKKCSVQKVKDRFLWTNIAEITHKAIKSIIAK